MKKKTLFTWSPSVCAAALEPRARARPAPGVIGISRIRSKNPESWWSFILEYHESRHWGPFLRPFVTISSLLSSLVLPFLLPQLEGWARMRRRAGGKPWRGNLKEREIGTQMYLKESESLIKPRINVFDERLWSTRFHTSLLGKGKWRGNIFVGGGYIICMQNGGRAFNFLELMEVSIYYMIWL